VEVTVDCRDVDGLLDAYLDRELEPAESASVRDHLGTCAACRQRLADRESLGRMIRRAPYYPMPDALRARLAQAPTRPSARASHMLQWAAGIALVASLAGSAWFLRSAVGAAHSTDAVEFVAEAVVDSHVRALMGDHLFDVRSTDQHTVKPWFLGKLDFSPPVDDLAPLGFPLTGGRLDYVAGRPVAALVYARAKHTINLFIWPEESATVRRSDVRTIRGFHVRHWTRGGMSFWAVSDLNDAELDQFVRALQQ
jgi:anti-sigma factor RsiW